MLPKGSLLVRPCSFTIVVGQPVLPGDYQTKEELLEVVRARIAELRQSAKSGESRMVEYLST